jgi:hypothetical protein
MRAGMAWCGAATCSISSSRPPRFDSLHQNLAHHLSYPIDQLIPFPMDYNIGFEEIGPPWPLPLKLNPTAKRWRG